jgi:hypothetical protein
MNIRISQLPQAPTAITGSELVPIVQNGQTVQTTVGAIANSPTQQQTFLTTNQEATLPNSRRIAGGLGIGVTDGGAQGQLSVALNAVSASLENASSGIIIKTSSNTIVNRSIAVSGSGLAVTNANGLAGNPTLALSGLPSVLAGISGTGFLVTAGGTTMGTATIVGTASQITVVGGNGSSTPTISIADNAIIYGTGSITIPNGTTGQRTGSFGAVRYNTSLGTFEGFIATGWQQFALSGGVTSFQTSLSGLTPSSSTTGVVTLAGTLGISSGGTGQVTANLAFNALAPSQTGNSGRYLTTDGVDTSWAVNPLGTVTSVAAVASTGISVTGSPITTSGTLTITNTAPDQTVVLTAGTGISTSGTYPNFTITNTSPSLGGDVVGPSSATDNAIVRFDTTTGKLIQNSTATLSDVGLLSTATITTTNDGTFNGITVGKGASSVSNNTVVGLAALDHITTGQQNVAMGSNALTTATTANNQTAIGYLALRVSNGADNTAVGSTALGSTTTGQANVAMGFQALTANTSGTSNTAIGRHALITNITGSNITALGNHAGAYETGSNALYIDAYDRTNTAGDKAGALLYGTFNATPSSQTLTINGQVTLPYQLNLNAALSLTSSTGTSGQVLTSAGAGTPTWTTPTTGTVTSVSGTGTVSGISLSGTVTTTGSLTLGGTLDLSSPPAIGATTPNTIKGTTITATTGIFGGGF